MEKSTKILLYIAYQVVLLTSFPSITNGSEPSERGLTIKLIHRDLPESPLYRPDLNEAQRMKNLILQSQQRLDHLLGLSNTTATEDFDTEALKSKVDHGRNSVYLAQVGIGTISSSPIPYFLHIDIAKELIWTQCQGCRSLGHHCFPQKQPVFPDARSISYHKLPCDRHSLCFPGQCLHGWCTYHVGFVNNSSSTTGFLATETFWFSGLNTPWLGWDTVPGIVFGCGFDQRNMGTDPYGGNAAGSMGLGWGPRSLPSQLGPRGQLRFSYCLVSSHANATIFSFLRFGSDAHSSRTDLMTTDIVQVGIRAPYFVNLVGISLGTMRLLIPDHVFSRRTHSPGRSGTIIETGAAFSSIVQPAYEILEQAVINHLLYNIPGIVRVHIPGMFKLCFKRPHLSGGVLGIPSIKFHFNFDVFMQVQPQALFEIGGVYKELICLAVLPAPYDDENGGLTLIGAFQQTNQRFIFDLGQKKLHFALESCARNR